MSKPIENDKQPDFTSMHLLINWNESGYANSLHLNITHSYENGIFSVEGVSGSDKVIKKLEGALRGLQPSE